MKNGDIVKWRNTLASGRKTVRTGTVFSHPRGCSDITVLYRGRCLLIRREDIISIETFEQHHQLSPRSAVVGPRFQPTVEESLQRVKESMVGLARLRTGDAFQPEMFLSIFKDLHGAVAELAREVDRLRAGMNRGYNP